MLRSSPNCSWAVAAVALAVTLLTPVAAVAGPMGGGHAGGHGGGFGGFGGFAGHAGGGTVASGSSRAFAHQGGAVGAPVRGGYYRGSPQASPTGTRGAYHGGDGGWRSNWHGIGLGVYVPFLPWYYETFWWNGVPYFYADDAYYLWDDDVGEYQAVEPPAGVSAPATTDAAGGPESSDLFAYPMGNQPAEQQARDRASCRSWAQTQASSGPQPAPTDPKAADEMRRQEFLHAEAACLEARNYSVK